MSAAIVLDVWGWPGAYAGPEDRARGAVVDSEELVERCKTGDPEAFRALFRQHRVEVLRLVQRMLGRSSDLEDVVQEVFLQVYRSIRDFKGQSRFSTWLYRVAVNVVLMHRRAARSRPQFSAVAEAQITPDLEPLPDEQVARAKRIQAFYRLLDRISEKKRTVFILHELEGVTPAEIARIVDSPVLTVRTRLFYARRELAAMLRDEPDLAYVANDIIAATATRSRKESAG